MLDGGMVGGFVELQFAKERYDVQVSEEVKRLDGLLGCDCMVRHCTDTNIRLFSDISIDKMCKNKNLYDTNW